MPPSLPHRLLLILLFAGFVAPQDAWDWAQPARVTRLDAERTLAALSLDDDLTLAVCAGEDFGGVNDSNTGVVPLLPALISWPRTIGPGIESERPVLTADFLAVRREAWAELCNRGPPRVS